MRVVVATDGSQCAQVALDLVRVIPWPRESVIHLVTSVDRGSSVYVPSMVGAVADPVEREVPMIGGIAGALDDLARPLLDTGAQIETHTLIGRPASAVVDLAETVRADLIVVGSRGHGTIGSMVLGSVSSEIADQAHCPVLVARRSSWHRATVATDGSTFARTAEDFVSNCPIFAPLPIEVISVADVQLSWASSLALSGYASSIDYPETVKAIDDEHELAAEESAGRLRSAGRSAAPRFVEGDAATEIIRSARESNADVIVVGTHGRTGVRRALAGSVARNVMLHAPCSVLVVREVRPLT